MDRNGIVRDSSIWSHPDTRAAYNRVDGLIRVGVVKAVFNDAETGELRYLVEVNSNGRPIDTNCRMLRRFGGVYNYEDYIGHGYNTNDSPDMVVGYNARAGDAVLVGQLNGQGREGVILGGLTHSARTTAIQADEGPQYDAEFNGMHTNINADGEWTLTFRGQPTNLDQLNSVPSSPISPATYDLSVGSSFMKFDKDGGWTISDNAQSNPQSIVINKPDGTITTTSGQITFIFNKEEKSVSLSCKTTTVDSSDSYSLSTQKYSVTASESAKINSPKVAIGHDGIELLNELSELIDALGEVIPISPVGPCTPLMSTPQWAQVKQVQSKINEIKGTLS
jgi:hypothetical protein